MKNDNNTNNAAPQENKSDKKITRKQALKKAGVLSLTTATMLILMKSPAKAATSAPTAPPTW